MKTNLLIMVNAMDVKLKDGGIPPRTMIAHIEHKFVDGCHFFSSPQIKGLLLASRDPNKILRQLAPSIQTLIKLNHGLDVTVELGAAFDTFQEQHCNSIVMQDQFAIIKKAA
jgi:hypothetical protein